MTSLLSRYFEYLERGQPWHWQGRVLESIGQTIESAGPLASIGECCEIHDQRGRVHLAEVIGFRGAHVLSMPVETADGVRFGDRVSALGVHPEVEAGALLPGAEGRSVVQHKPRDIRSLVPAGRRDLRFTRSD